MNNSIGRNNSGNSFYFDENAEKMNKEGRKRISGFIVDDRKPNRQYVTIQ